jgi:hypothetical protein
MRGNGHQRMQHDHADHFTETPEVLSIGGLFDEL